MGGGFIKVCAYFPYPVKVWVNGHEWAKRQALAAGLAFTALSNGFASCADPAALQEICDRFGPGTCSVFEKWWLHPLPLTFAARDHDAGSGGSCPCGRWRSPAPSSSTCRAMPAGSSSRCCARTWTWACPENAELLFRRGETRGFPSGPPPGGLDQEIDQRCELVTMNVFYKSRPHRGWSRSREIFAGLRVGGWLGLPAVAGWSWGCGFPAGSPRGDAVSGVRAGCRGWEGGGGLFVTKAYLWDRSPYKSLAAGTRP